MPLIILAALGDSLNPCAFAVLIFLVTFLVSINKRGLRFLLIGGIYIFFVYLTYFFAGSALLSAAKRTGFTSIFYQLTAFIVIIAGFINLKDFLWYGRGFSLKIPDSAKHIIQKYIQASSIPATISLGILVSIFELPCTGGIYFAILGLLAEKATLIQGVLYLLLYNLIFVFPLILILIISYFSLSSETLNTWRKKNQKWMRLIMGVTMLTLGFMMLFS